MRKLLYILLAAVALTLVMGCGRSVDKRLVLADTLMWTVPDSSLKILTAINRDSLQDKENLAYHALLLTQAQFRCNGNCESDTLINLALSHYSDNHNREHYTRALLYKGSFYEVHDNPVEAIKWYKRAEDNADTTDYRNLAQINLRMGKLYYDNYASNNLDLEKFKKAYKYYNESQDKRMSMIVLGYMGNIYRANDHKKAIECLNKAKRIAVEIKDMPSYYNYQNELSMAYFLDSLFLEAKDAAMECVNNTTPSNAILFNAANAYAALNKPDSASYYLAMVDTVAMSDYDRMMTAFARGYIYKALGNEKDALFYNNLGTSISDTIKEKSSRNLIYEAENIINDELQSKRDKNISKQNLIFASLLAIVIILSIIFIINTVLKNHKFRKLVKELNTNQFYVRELVKETQIAYEQLDKERQESNQLKQQQRALSGNLDFLNHYFNSFNSLLNKCYNVKRGDFVKELELIIKQASADDKYWTIIIDVADKKTAGFISELNNGTDILSQNEIKILSLVCLGYNNDAISTSTGYNRDSIKTIKTRIKNKINASENLDAFTKQVILKRNTSKG